MVTEDSVRQLLIDFTHAFEKGDINALNGMFIHDDALLFYGTHDKLHFQRWPEVEDSFRKQITALKDLRCRIDGDIHVRLLAGGAVACAGTADFAMGGLMGEMRIDVTGIRLTCTVERHDDRWQFVQMHLSVSDRQFLDRVKQVSVKYF